MYFFSKLDARTLKQNKKAKKNKMFNIIDKHCNSIFLCFLPRYDQNKCAQGLKATTGGLWSSSPPISQTLCHWSNSIKNLWEETTVIHSHRFVNELLHRHKVCELGGDKLHRPPVVALKQNIYCKRPRFIRVVIRQKHSCLLLNK